MSTPIRLLGPPHSTAPNTPVIALHSPVGRNAVWIELLHEQGDALGLIVLTYGGRHLLQPTQATQEAAVGRVGPANVAGSSPAIGAQRVEAAVIADPKRRVPFDVVAAEIGQCGPRGHRSRVGCDDPSNHVVAILLRCCERIAESLLDSGRLGRQHRARRTGGMHGDRVLTHALTLRPMVRR